MKCTYVFTAVTLSSFISLSHPAISQQNTLLDNFMNIPLVFTENPGHRDRLALFTAHANHSSMIFTKSGITLRLRHETEQSDRNKKRTENTKKIKPENEFYTLKMNFVGANADPEIAGEGLLPWKSNYFIGRDPSGWKKDVPNYSGIRVKNIYNGIDLIYSGDQRNLKYDFVIQSGSDPSVIALQYTSENCIKPGKLKINNKGELVIDTPFGSIIERKPYCYQEMSGRKIVVESGYAIINADDGTYTFSIASYDQRFPLIIDPEITFSTFIGGSTHDYCWDMAIDDEGNTYITGATYSSDFAVTSGSIDTSFNGGNRDVFVCKLNAAGNALVYSTYIGGDNSEYGIKIALDAENNLYVTGYTESSDFPSTAGAFDSSFNGGTRDAYICKLNPEGDELVYSTFLGGSDWDFGSGVTVDGMGNAYISGYTYSDDFPVSYNAFDDHLDGLKDAFISKVHPSGRALVYSTYLGGSGEDSSYDIAVDKHGKVYVTGETRSSNFPVTSGAYAENLNGYYDDIFLSKLNELGNALIYSTLIGGSGGDWGRGIAVDAHGSVYITGTTGSNDFPVTQGAYDVVFSGEREAVVCKFDSSGTSLVYSTYLGGSGGEYSRDIAIDSDGNAYITGYTDSEDFPEVSVEGTNGHSGSFDVFVTKINESGNDLLFSTLQGGSQTDFGYSIVIGKNRSVYIAGYTMSADFPTIYGAFSDSINGGFDVFVCKFDFTATGISRENYPPDKYILYQNYPNPFNPQTSINFSLPVRQFTSITIYSASGRHVKTITVGNAPAGNHRVYWDGTNNAGIRVGSGIYIYRLQAGRFTASRKMLLIR